MGVLNTLVHSIAHVHVRHIKAHQYPLYVVTESVSRDVLGGLKNIEQIRQLDGDEPFLCVHIRPPV